MVDVGGIASERLKTIIERVERLEEEKAALAEDIREVYSEAKAAGCANLMAQTGASRMNCLISINAPWIWIN